MKIVAIIALRNEEHYLRYVLQYLLDEEIEVVLIDHASTDSSFSIYSEFISKNILDVVRLPFLGNFSLDQQLRLKRIVVSKIDARWIIHHDADEIIQSSRRGESLRDMITRVDELGFNAINFDEFVFIPEDEKVDYRGKDYFEEMSNYYFFEPCQQRLIRAYKKDLDASNVFSGGHQLEGNDIAVFPDNMILRHYIGLSKDMIIKKYSKRLFDKDEVTRGWHNNRVNRDWEALQIPSTESLCSLKDGRLSKERPYVDHFWDWEITA